METDQFIVKWFKRKFKASRFASVIAKWQEQLDWNANYLENHDQTRCVTRFGDDEKYWNKSAKMLAVLLLTLRGTPFVYQGQEIGMTNFDFTDMSELRDIESFNVNKLAAKLKIPKSYRWHMMKTCSRDNARTPMQWNASKGAGFTEGTPWIGINKNNRSINYEQQLSDPNSILNFYKRAIALRSENKILIDGTYKTERISGDLFIFHRKFENEKLVVVVNFGKKTHALNLSGKTLLSNYDKTHFDGVLLPYEAVVIKK